MSDSKTPALDEMTQQMMLAHAQQLIAAIEAGDTADIEKSIDDLTKMRETELFNELGRLTRDLHEALKAFAVDSRIFDLAEKEIPNAQERLTYVITVTEQSAHKTLTAIEESIPVVEDYTSKAADLSDRWKKFRNRQMSLEEFKDLSKEVENYFETLGEQSQKVQQNLNDALMAQDFQDITGQIIRKVINLVTELEDNLVRLVRISGGRFAVEGQEETAEEGLAGPVVPGVDDVATEVVHGQDEVDDLLSSLGF